MLLALWWAHPTGINAHLATWHYMSIKAIAASCSLQDLLHQATLFQYRRSKGPPRHTLLTNDAPERLGKRRKSLCRFFTLSSLSGLLHLTRLLFGDQVKIFVEISMLYTPRRFLISRSEYHVLFLCRLQEMGNVRLGLIWFASDSSTILSKTSPCKSTQKQFDTQILPNEC